MIYIIGLPNGAFQLKFKRPERSWRNIGWWNWNIVFM